MVTESESLLEKIKHALPELDYEAALKICVDDTELLLELLQDFSKLPVKDTLAKFFAEDDHKNYCIRIHGFKNNAYSVGARKLGDLAYEMEQLTRETIPEEIADKQRILFEEYDRICGIYRSVTGNGGIL